MATDMLVGVCVRVYQVKDWANRKIIKGLGGMLAVLPCVAFADGDDIAGMFDAAAEGSTSMTKSALKVAQLLGVLAVIGGLIAAKTKKDNPQIKTSHIIGSILFGVCLVVVPEIIKRSQAQVGLTPVSVG